MQEVDIRQIAVNNHIYNLKKKELQRGNTRIDSIAYKNDTEQISLLKKIVESGSYILDYETPFKVLFNLGIFRSGFMNFLQINFLKDKKSYTTATGNLILQDALNVIYLKQPVNFDKYRYVLSETNESIITDKDNQLNKELILKLPDTATMLTPADEIINIISIIGWRGLVTMIELIYKVNIK
jgi:hypothetical protein